MENNKHTAMNIEVSCHVCNKAFNKNVTPHKMASALGDDGEHTCYSCVLDRITKGHCPEEGDFNSARIISGEMSDQERRWLQEDLRSVESGGSSRWTPEPEEDVVDEEPYGCPYCDDTWCDCQEIREEFGLDAKSEES